MIAAAGVPGILQPEHITPGATVVGGGVRYEGRRLLARRRRAVRGGCRRDHPPGWAASARRRSRCCSAISSTRRSATGRDRRRRVSVVRVPDRGRRAAVPVVRALAGRGGRTARAVHQHRCAVVDRHRPRHLCHRRDRRPRRRRLSRVVGLGALPG